MKRKNNFTHNLVKRLFHPKALTRENIIWEFHDILPVLKYQQKTKKLQFTEKNELTI